MKRRAFIAGLAGVAAWPLAVHAQETGRVRRIGVLMGGSEDGYRPRLAAFRQGLEQLGWREGHNLRTEVRWAASDPQRTADMAREIVALQPEVILAGPSHVIFPLKNVARAIPIVFVNVSDPVSQGIVDNIARPAGNITGFTNQEFSLLGKWLQMVMEIAPGIRRAALMIFTGNAASPHWYALFPGVATSLGVEPLPVPVRNGAEIEGTIERLAGEPKTVLIVPGDTLVLGATVRQSILALTARHRIPTIYGRPEFVTEGGLIAYGIDQTEPYRGAANYVDRILKGEKPGDLPVQSPTKYELLINLKAARTLGLDVPAALLVRADEVIE